MNWIIPAVVALIAFGGQFSATLWGAGARLERFESLQIRVTEMERRIDQTMASESTRDLLQARLEERITSVLQDLARVHTEASESNRHLTAIEDFLYRKGGKDVK